MHMHHQTAALPCACTSLRKAARAISRVYDAELAAAGMTAAQLAILRAIDRAGSPPLAALATALVMDRTSLYRALAPLQRAGWVSLADAPRGRARLASLTAEGARALREAAPYWEAAQRRVLEAFGPVRWRDLHAGLAALTAVGIEAAP